MRGKCLYKTAVGCSNRGLRAIHSNCKAMRSGIYKLLTKLNFRRRPTSDNETEIRSQLLVIRVELHKITGVYQILADNSRTNFLRESTVRSGEIQCQIPITLSKTTNIIICSDNMAFLPKFSIFFALLLSILIENYLEFCQKGHFVRTEQLSLLSSLVT